MGCRCLFSNHCERYSFPSLSWFFILCGLLRMRHRWRDHTRERPGVGIQHGANIFARYPVVHGKGLSPDLSSMPQGRTYKINCPAHISFLATKDEKCLEVIEVVYKHTDMLSEGSSWTYQHPAKTQQGPCAFWNCPLWKEAPAASMQCFVDYLGHIKLPATVRNGRTGWQRASFQPAARVPSPPDGAPFQELRMTGSHVARGQLGHVVRSRVPQSPLMSTPRAVGH
ncbi:uncharacterized protein [Dermacentor albipictus]|uniref:uncharacterized protein isoform X2 n=1 Tax=Dermacentor albipictus TaxID=60249 RepID=UPI0038FC32C8